MKQKRSYGYDNLRALLIVCVVAGHLLELVSGAAAEPLRKALYFLIYSFHIPALIYLNGQFARFSWKRLLRYFGLYLLFQTAYLLFVRYMLGSASEFQFHTPYWLLWYLLSLPCYLLLVPALERVPWKYAAVVMLASVLLSLLAGYEEDIGYQYSLSRTVVFLPFFVLGHFAGRQKDRLRRFLHKKPGLWCWLGAAALGITALLYGTGVTKNMLYGSYSYAIGYGPVIRLMVLLTAFLWTGALLSLFLTAGNRKLPMLSVVGRNTMPVYLLHGFLVRLIGTYNWDRNSLLVAVFLTILLVLALGNPWVGSIFNGTWKNVIRKKTAGNPK